MTVQDLETQMASLGREAVLGLQRRDFARAIASLEQALSLDPRRIELWLNLAAAHRASAAPEAALRAADEALKLEPRHFRALLLRGSLLERLQGERAAGPVYGAALLQAPRDERLDEATRRALARAREINLRYGSDLNAALRASVEDLPLSPAASKNAQVFVDLLTGRRRNFRQEPLGYFYPGLPAIEFWDRSHFPWLEALERDTPAIVEEMREVGFDDPMLTPYIDFPDTQPLDQWAELNRSPRWTAFHLYQHGRRIDQNCARCPATLGALADVDQPVAVNRSPSAMFSILKPRTRIPPHTGVSNTRLVAHLALVVPDGCGFRVGNETRPWRVGGAWVFDDTIEHEAWNDSGSPRAVLIFDIWNPLIPPDQREAIARIMSGMDAFTGAADSGL